MSSQTGAAIVRSSGSPEIAVHGWTPRSHDLKCSSSDPALGPEWDRTSRLPLSAGDPSIAFSRASSLPTTATLPPRQSTFSRLRRDPSRSTYASNATSANGRIGSPVVRAPASFLPGGERTCAICWKERRPERPSSRIARRVHPRVFGTPRSSAQLFAVRLEPPRVLARHADEIASSGEYACGGRRTRVAPCHLGEGYGTRRPHAGVDRASSS